MVFTAIYQVVPIKFEGSLKDLIDGVVEVVKSSGLRYEVNAHSTVVEGSLDELMELLKRITEFCQKMSERCVVSFQVDLKRGGVTMGDKVKGYR